MKVFTIIAGALLGLALNVQAGAINDKCPISGKAVDADATSTVDIGFCCNKCKGKFDKNPGKMLKKASKAEDGKCLVSGKDVGDAKSTVTVGFCCGKCKTKFDKDPKKGLANVKAAKVKEAKPKKDS